MLLLLVSFDFVFDFLVPMVFLCVTIVFLVSGFVIWPYDNNNHITK